MFIIKRILSFSKKSVMEISATSTYKSFMYESNVAEPEIVLFTEIKAKELMVGGTKITKEILDQMELSSSSSEESYE